MSKPLLYNDHKIQKPCSYERFGMFGISTTYKEAPMHARTREQVVFLFPRYPSSRKSGEGYQLFTTRHRFTQYQNWARWIKELCEPKKHGLRIYLIRLPGGHYAQPRSEADHQYHVKANTPRKKKRKPTIKEQTKKANQAITRGWTEPDPFV